MACQKIPALSVRWRLAYDLSQGVVTIQTMPTEDSPLGDYVALIPLETFGGDLDAAVNVAAAFIDQHNRSLDEKQKGA